jgi:hypothetical protein
MPPAAVRPAASLLAALALAAPAAADCRFTLPFAFASAEIAPADRQLLDRLAARYPAADFALTAHADSDGAEPGNRRIAEARAAAVAGHLARRGVTARVLALADHWPDAPNAASGALNRRVELRVAGCDPADHPEARRSRTRGLALIGGRPRALRIELP